jgi:hypothetical protein
MGLGDKTSVIINRADQALAVPSARVAEFLGVPLAAQIRDDTFEVQRAVGEASSIVNSQKGRNSKISLEFRKLARGLLRTLRDEGERPAPANPERIAA